MAYTAAQVAQLVLDRLTGQGEDASNLFLPDIESCIKDALVQLGLTNKDYFQKTFNCAITANVASFASHLTAPEPLVIEFPFPEVTHASVTDPLLPVGDRTILRFSSSYDFGYYTVVDNDILLKPPTGVTLSGNVVVLGSFTPLLTSVPDQLIPALVLIIIGMLPKR
jgi:hypothetical protein